MPIGIRQLEWLNHNSQRAYPLTADSTRTDLSGVFRIPDDLIVSLYLPVHWGNNITPGNFYIKSIANYPTGISITVGYSGDKEVIVATTVVARDSHETNQVYNMSGVGEFSDSRGFVVINGFSGLDKQPAGLFTFNLAGGRLEPDALRPQISGVMSVQVINGQEVSDKYAGRIRLAAGRNFRLTATVPEAGDPIVVFDAISGEGFVDACVCQDSAPPIKSINGAAPDSNGNIQIITNDCLDVKAAGNVVTLTDLCSEPCCGCKELEALTQALEAFGEKATTLENFLVNLESRVTQMDMVVLGSRLGDRGCEASG